MNWISLVGLLVVSSSALGRSMYDSYSSRSLHKPKLNMDTPLPTYAYGAVDHGVQSMPTSYGSPYGAAQRHPLFDEPKQKVEAPTLPLTEADILCKGRQAETVIPIGEGFKFIVCLDESKGVEQFCPTGLFYKSETRRCERKFGLSTDPCVSQPCLNNGQCVRTEYSYQCQCAPGFDGRTCELDSRICQTQQPCGQSFDSKCQSFHVGAALQHVCILQDGLFYGLDTRQTYASPCTGDNGPHPLAFSNKGFIMCDGDFLFVQSCPGGTIWDDFNKACVWPEMENIVTIKPNENFLKQNYGQSKYDTSIETPRFPSFGLEIEKPRVSSNWNKIETSRVPSLGLTIETPRVLSYDTKIETPRLESYGAQIEIPRVSSNWNKIETSRVPSLGLKIETPRVLSRWNDVQHLPMKPVPIETPRVESNWNQIETPGVTSNWNQIERPAVPSFGVNLVKPQESSYWNEVQHLPMKPALSETPRVESNWNQIERPGVPSFGVNLVKPQESSYWNQVEQLPTKPTFSEKPNEVIRMNSMLVGKQQDFIPMRQSSGY